MSIRSITKISSHDCKVINPFLRLTCWPPLDEKVEQVWVCLQGLVSDWWESIDYWFKNPSTSAIPLSLSLLYAVIVLTHTHLGLSVVFACSGLAILMLGTAALYSGWSTEYIQSTEYSYRVLA